MAVIRIAVIRIIDVCAWGLRFLGAAALVFMALSVFYDTMMRYLFLAPTSWSLEINSILVAAIAFIPAAHVLRERQQLRIGLIQDQLTGIPARVVATLIGLCGMAFCVVLTWRGGMIAYDAWLYGERMSTVLGTPKVLPYSLIPIGFGALGLAFLANTLEVLAGVERREDGAPL
ncbi:TRAP transporter small permease [Rhodovibrio salinarum]|uniref:TRAP transporter small permease protein n=1 Tax=Rhodovibrio salinarum TaxID=1087 RepID=A0A934QF94_9PROT|nr:TRAP transporter small permease [Rhodovibrio salinarum]MBK1695763.1 TRAP transporter small permease [Rhodovibrio salinarum]